MRISCEFRRDTSEKKRAMKLLSLVLYVVMAGDRITRPVPLRLNKSKTEPPVHCSLKKKRYTLIRIVVVSFTRYGWRQSISSLLHIALLKSKKKHNFVGKIKLNKYQQDNINKEQRQRSYVWTVTSSRP